MAEPTVIKIAVFAVGGQGGGVLADWIVQLAENNHWAVQSTAVAGVAQRTGATFYYIEMADVKDGRRPVFALAPAEGDVDIVIAAELMEAGRAIMRGFVTPDKSNLIASSHRMLSVSEKVVPGSGLANPEEVLLAAQLASIKLTLFDMQRIASDAGTVVSASLFGALAGAGCLPFSLASYTAAIRQSGRGVDASLVAFEAACRQAMAPETAPAAPAREAKQPTVVANPQLLSQWQDLTAQLSKLPLTMQAMAQHGLVKVVDFQDLDYGREYLQRLLAIAEQAGVQQQLSPHSAGQSSPAEDAGAQFSIQCAKYLANAMCYDDVIRVADLKTRHERSERIREEFINPVKGDANPVLQVTEFMHPRAQEFISMLPVKVSRWVDKRPWLVGYIDRRINKGRRLRSDKIHSFALLYAVAGLRRWRRKMARHAHEMQRIDQWLQCALQQLPSNPALATEILKCQRLVKGYSDTHSRSLSKYKQVMEAIPGLKNSTDAASLLAALIEAALADADGQALADKIAVLAPLDRSATPQTQTP